MPVCVVKQCKNNTTRNKKDTGITYHQFPVDPDMCDRWTAVVRLSREQPWWKPGKRCVICSVHFNESDFYYTKGGLKRLSKGSVPKNMLFLSNLPDDILCNQPSTSTTLTDNETARERSHGPKMVRNYKRKKEKHYTEDQLLRAVEEVRGKKINSYDAAKKYGIPRSTIIARLYGTRGSKMNRNLETYDPVRQPDDDNFNNASSSTDACVSETRSYTIKLEPMESEETEEDDESPDSFSARGLVPPVFTPMNDDGTINFQLIPSYAKYLADSGITAVLVGGTTGENMSLQVGDRMKLVDWWVEASEATGLHIMVQVGGAPLADVLTLAKYCQKAGAHSLLTLPELYFKPSTVGELVSYVKLVAEAAPRLPVLYYHIPSMSRVEINMPKFVVAATETIPNFKGIKFTSNDLSEAAQVLRCLEKGQEIFLGADTLIAPAALLGIKSSIGTTFNLLPSLAQQILRAVEENQVPRARLLQEKLSMVIEAHTCEGPWVPIMKAGMEILTGIKVGPPSLPQQPLSDEAKARIAARLAEIGVDEFVTPFTQD